MLYSLAACKVIFKILPVNAFFKKLLKVRMSTYFKYFREIYFKVIVI